VSTTTTGSGSEEEANVKFCFPNISPLSTEWLQMTRLLACDCLHPAVRFFHFELKVLKHKNKAIGFFSKPRTFGYGCHLMTIRWTFCDCPIPVPTQIMKFWHFNKHFDHQLL
jgi:hypothetical protein